MPYNLDDYNRFRWKIWCWHLPLFSCGKVNRRRRGIMRRETSGRTVLVEHKHFLATESVISSQGIKAIRKHVAFFRNTVQNSFSKLWILCTEIRPPLWSSGQSFWLQIPRSRVRFLALSDFLRSSGSGTVPTQPREDNWGATWRKKVAAPV
jgi:hypothetical protein